MIDCPYERLPSGFWKCPICGHVTIKPYDRPPRRNCQFPQPHGTLRQHAPPPYLPDHGPGTELKKIFDALGIQTTDSCQCAARMDEMNRRGVQGCIDTKPEVMGWLKEAYDEASTLTAIRAGLNSLRGYPKTLAGLLDLAIENARRLSPPPSSQTDPRS